MSVVDRAVYGTRKHRAQDLEAGDVTRNRFGKWDVVTSVKTDSDHYVVIGFEVGDKHTVRTVHLMDVQIAKPS